MSKQRPKKIGSYRVLGVLGQGGMGVVYRAEDVETGESVALKTVRLPHAGLLQGFRREIHTLARIRHQCIVRIVNHGVFRGLPWYAMELVEGVSLAQYAPGRRRDAPTVEVERVPEADLRARAAKKRREKGAARESNVADEPTDPLFRDPDAVRAGPVRKEETTRMEEALSEPASGNRTDTMSGSSGGVSPTDTVTGKILSWRSSDSESPSKVPDGASRSWTSFEELRPILTLVRRLCDPLSYLHGEGIVHGDLKPANVLIRPGGVPVLVDFGVTSQFHGPLSLAKSRIERGVVGTVNYMAPEQARGVTVDARADLYSLGCILYELLTGAPPFVSESAYEVVRSHIHTKPLQPSKLVRGVPPELERLILRLLQKKPQDRMGYADDVAAALERIGAENPPPVRARRPRVYLYQPRLCGRNDQLKILHRHLGALGEGRGRVVVLGGESGVGKTRLIMEFSREAVRGKVRVLTGECSNARVRPLQGLLRPLQAIADQCREKGAEEAERILGRRGPLLSLYEPLLEEIPGMSDHPPPVELAPAAARRRLFRYLSEVLSELASRGPVLLVIEDLQWADQLTIGFLEALAQGRTLETSRLLVVGTYRNDAPAPGLHGLFSCPGVTNLVLDRLDSEAVTSIVGDMLAYQPPPEVFSKFVVEQSEGNPFFIAEYLQAAVAEGLLFRDEHGLWQVRGERDESEILKVYRELPLPRSLRHLVERRLIRLPSVARKLIELAAVVGRNVSTSLLYRASRLRQDQFYEALADLLRHQILEEVEATGDLRFVHDKLREVAYQRLTVRRRPQLHRTIARSMERLFLQDRELRFAELAWHWRQAGNQEKAREFYLAAARRARDRYAQEEAEHLYGSFLELSEQPSPERVAAANELGRRVLGIQGRYEEAVVQHQQALADARQLADSRLEASSLECLGWVYFVQGAMIRARSFYEEALRIANQTGDQKNEARILVDLATLNARQGRTQDSCFLYEQALATAMEVGDRHTERLALGYLADLHRDLGNLAGARPVYGAVLALAVELGDREGEGQVLNHLSILERADGNYEEAWRLCERALAIFQEIGDLPGEARVLTSLGGMHVGKGWLPGARKLYARALTIERESGRVIGQGIVLTHLANLRRVEGLLDDALELVEQALLVFRDLEDGMETLRALCCKGHILLALGKSARHWLQQARKLDAQLGVVGQAGASSQAVERLQRAQDAFESHTPARLFRGKFIADIPPGLRGWMVETGQLAKERGNAMMEKPSAPGKGKSVTAETLARRRSVPSHVSKMRR